MNEMAKAQPKAVNCGFGGKYHTAAAETLSPEIYVRSHGRELHMWLLTRKFQARKQSVFLKYLDIQKEKPPPRGGAKRTKILRYFCANRAIASSTSGIPAFSAE